MANPSTSQTSTDQSEANWRQEEVKQAQEQHSKELKQETDQPAESMVTEQVDAKKVEHVQEMLVGNPGASQNTKDLNEETSPSSEAMVTEQLDVENPKILVEDPRVAQKSKELKEETSLPSESMVTEQVEMKKEEHVPEMLVENPGASQNSNDLKEGTRLPSESMVTEQVEMTKEEHVPEMLVENPGASQNTNDLKEGTGLPSESMVSEQVDVAKVKNVQEMLVENPGSLEDVMQMNTAQGLVERITQLERDTEETEVACVTTEDNELMETHQGNTENVVDELVVAVNDSTNLSERRGNVDCIETSSESMETDQLTSKEDGVTEEVTQITTHQSHNQALRGDVTEGEVVDNDSTVNRAGAGSNDVTMLQMSVAMEVDTQGENSDANSPTKVELSEREASSKHLQESEISLDREPNKGLNSGEDGASTVMNVDTMAECDTNEGSVLADTSSEDSGLCTTPATDT